MSQEKQANLSVAEDSAEKDATPPESGDQDMPRKKTKTSESKKKEPWHVFAHKASEGDIKKRFKEEAKSILDKYKVDLENYCVIALLDPDSSIGSFDLDKIFSALTRVNNDKEKDILLVILSPGGSIEPAYQISKLCKAFSANNFSVAVPRQAKSAATLISIGADQIHMGPLGQLGPIDPQLGGLPALGVTQALESIASLSERFPGSSDMFAKYLRLALTVEQIGYCERISESAAQYAERLLSTKSKLPKKPGLIAKELVHEYKDHGFVIDLDEAREHLGSEWVISDSKEVQFSEEIYSLLEEVNLMLEIIRNKRLLVIGTFEDDVMVFDRKK